MTLRRSLTLALAVLLASCTGLGVQHHTITEGTPDCVDGDFVRVRFNGCLSSSCDTLVSASCTVSVAGGVAEIAGRADVDSEGNECTDDCGFMVATCAGSIGEATTLRFGSTTVQRSELRTCSAVP